MSTRATLKKVALQKKNGTYQRLPQDRATCPYCQMVVIAPLVSSKSGNPCECGVLEVYRDDKGSHYLGETPVELSTTSAAISDREREEALSFINMFKRR